MVRTFDILLPNQARYQLRYTRIFNFCHYTTAGGENQRFFCLWSFMWSKPLLCCFRQSGEILQTQASQGFATFRSDLSRIQPRHSQTTRATNCATPGYIYFLVCFLLIIFLLSVRSASLRNIVAALRLVRSLRSLFLHLGAMPLSAPDGGISPRPTESESLVIFYLF